MWTDFINLEEVFVFWMKQIAYNSSTGFSFCSISPGNNFTEAFEILGKPALYNIESEQQQTAEYNSFIDHPRHGKREHHRLNLLLWAFNQEPISIVKLHFNYYNTGLDAEPFKISLNAFLNNLSEKLGPPNLKKLVSGKQELSYKIGSSKLHIWNNPEGVRLEIK
jgi:hypothetical protein